jgi:hypothetical protein
MRLLLSSLLLATLLTTPAWSAVRFSFDYTYDTGGFFADPSRRSMLELAGDLTLRYVDDLAEIEPTGEQAWSYTFFRPDTGGLRLLENQTIAADEVLVYVGGADLAGNTLALADRIYPTPASGDAEWEATVRGRGQAGATQPQPTDYGPVGGTIRFNATDFDWHFGSTPPNAGQFDFLTVAMHELLTVLGFGPAESFHALVDENGAFTGSESLAVGSLTNPTLQTNGAGRWAAGTESVVAGQPQEANMAPFFSPGERRMITDLDHAALEDIGWQAAAPGDTDRDGDVDASDIQQILVAGGFGNGFGYGWSAGDQDGDGDVDSLDIQAILVAGHFGQGPYVATQGGETVNGLDVSDEAVLQSLAALVQPAVPEPNAGLLLAVLVLTVLRGCRGKTPSRRAS